MAVKFSAGYPKVGTVACSPPGGHANSAASYLVQAVSTLGQAIDYTFTLMNGGSPAPTAEEVLDVSNKSQIGLVFRGTSVGVGSGVEEELFSNFLVGNQAYDVYFVAVESGSKLQDGPTLVSFVSADCGVEVGPDQDAPEPSGTIPQQTCALGDNFDLDVTPFFTGDIDAYYMLIGPSYLGTPGSEIVGGMLSGVANTAGTFDIAVRAENNITGASADQSFQKVTIGPPAWTGVTPTPATCVEEQAITPMDLSIYFTGQITNYVIAGEPSGLTINSSGVLSGTPAMGTAMNSPYGITVTAVGPGGSDSFVLTKAWSLPPETEPNQLEEKLELIISLLQELVDR